VMNPMKKNGRVSTRARGNTNVRITAMNVQ
jgi:hypothetical protein